MKPVERLLTKLPDAKQAGKGWSARCPAHDDRRPSLSVSEGDDGRALVKCHAGCTLDAVCGAMGLRVSDLMSADPSGTSTSTKSSHSSSNGQYRRRRQQKTYPTASDALAELDCIMEKEAGQRVAQWTYHDAHGEPVAVVCRYDLPTPDGEKQAKTFRPVSRSDDGWVIRGMQEPRPLYCLPELAGADHIFITEGEKAADAARSIGLTATTSAHGSKSASKTDWKPLAGKLCVILRDNNQAGQDYAHEVAVILIGFGATVKVVLLPGLPDGGDIVDWIDGRGDAIEPEELKRQVEALADEAEAIQLDRPAASIERFIPFPTDALPKPIRGFVVAGAKAIGCDSSYLALPMLSSLAAAIGNTRRIQLKRGWSAPAII